VRGDRAMGMQTVMRGSTAPADIYDNESGLTKLWEVPKGCP